VVARDAVETRTASGTRTGRGDDVRSGGRTGMIILQLGKVNATDVAELFGTSRDAVYAARYRYRQGYPPRRRRGRLGVKYVQAERPAGSDK
jgi:hypothetical protein